MKAEKEILVMLGMFGIFLNLAMEKWQTVWPEKKGAREIFIL